MSSPSGNVVPMLRTPPPETVGDRLRRVRREIHLGQVEFAGSLRMTKSLLSAYESGRLPVPDKGVWALAKRVEKLYGFPAAWLVSGASPTNPDEGIPAQSPRADLNRRPTAYNSVVPGQVRRMAA